MEFDEEYSLRAMGEARRRHNKTPSLLDKVRRRANRLLNMYPKPLRQFVAVELQLTLMLGVLLAVLLIAAVAVGILRR
jgi:hypothetical protein